MRARNGYGLLEAWFMEVTKDEAQGEKYFATTLMDSSTLLPLAGRYASWMLSRLS